MKRFLTWFVVLVMFSLSVGPMAFAQDEITIAISVPRLSNPFFGRAVKVIEQVAKDEGVRLITLDANDSSSRQQTDLETMIIRRVDGVLMAPNDSEALVPVIQELTRAGIPVVTVDRRVTRGDYLAHVGADNVEGARLAAKYIVDQHEGGKVVQLLGTPGSSPALDRGRGFDEVMDANPQFDVITQPANFRRSDAVTVMENILQAHPDVKAVFTHNEEMGLGVIQVLRQRGFDPGDVTVVAFDTHEETIAALENGWLQGNVEQFPDMQFRNAFRMLVQKIRTGEDPIQKDNYITPMVITKNNIIQSEKWGE